jgi:hypothetical protein
MANVNVLRKGTSWFLLLAFFVVTGFVRAQDGDHLSQKELKSLIASAKTPQDHERIAKHFDDEAKRMDAEANDHEELAAQYKANPSGQESKHPMSGRTAGHCSYFAADLHKAAKEDRALAADHRAMATDTGK